MVESPTKGKVEYFSPLGYGVKDGFTGCLFYAQDGFAGQDSQTGNNLLRFKVDGMSFEGMKGS